MNGALRTKLIPGTNCLVDGFKLSRAQRADLSRGNGNGNGCCQHGVVRFLSHFHGDHYAGLSKEWDEGVVHCSKVTATLLVKVMEISSSLVKGHEMGEVIQFEGFQVVLLDANHCPGAALLLVKRDDGAVFLHCGDMRYTPAMKEVPALIEVRNKVDTIFLDTTYAHPNHVFPTQKETIEKAVQGIRTFMDMEPDEKCLVLISAYNIGKERIVFGICEALGFDKIFLTEKKRKVMGCLGLPESQFSKFCDDPSAKVHVCPMGTVGVIWPFFQPNFTNIRKYIDELYENHSVEFRRVIALIPTGWADASNYNKQNAVQLDPTNNISVNLVSYSEHSNYTELEEFVGFLRPRQVLPTVYSDQKHYRNIVHRFRNLVDVNKSKQLFLKSFSNATKPHVEILAAESQSSSSSPVQGGDQVEVIELDEQEESSSDSKKPSSATKLENEDQVDPGQWACVLCTFLNDESKHTSECEMCGNKRSDTSKTPKKRTLKSASPTQRQPKLQKTTLLSFFAKPAVEEKAVTPPDEDKCIEIKTDSKPHQPHTAVVEVKTLPEEIEGTPIKSPPSVTGAIEIPGNLDLEEDTHLFNIPSLEGEKPVSFLQDIDYSLLSHALSKVVNTTKRLVKNKVLVNMFHCAIRWTNSNPDVIHKLAFLTIGKIANDHESVELSVGGSMISKAIVESTGAPKKQLSKLYKELGDVGDVAYECKRSQRTLFVSSSGTLTVNTVFDTLHKIASEKGQGSESRRKGHILKLMRKAQGEEMRFLVRLIIGNTRIGANEVSVLDALVEAVLQHSAGPGKQLEKSVVQDSISKARLAFNRMPDVKRFVTCLLHVGVEGILEACKMTPGVPVRPMLAQVCHGVEEFIATFGGKGGYTCEFKYDGQRIQVHLLPSGEFEIFSRHCQSNTGKFPDVIDILKNAKDESVISFIMDAEVVAIDRQNGNKILPFQTLSTRARKAVVDDGSKREQTVEVAVFSFDLIELNGDSLVHLPLRERRRLLNKSFRHEPGFYHQVQAKDFDPVKDEEKDAQVRSVMGFMQDALTCCCEGLVAKLLDTEEASYEPNKRSTTWLKLKQDYVENVEGDEEGAESRKLSGGGLGDTLDLVPIGAWHGSGRKSKWWSPFLLACYDPETETFQSLCKVMSGFSDEFYQSQNEFYSACDDDGTPRTLSSKPFEFDSSLVPSVWFKPCQVWEVRGAELTLSPVHRAGLGLMPGNPEQCMSMRFPRFVRVRPDKLPEQATSSQQLRDLFLAQTRR